MNVIITGASRGIGLALAEKFAANGHPLLLTSVNEINLYQAMEKLHTHYNDCSIHAKAFDLSVKENCTAFGHWCLQYGQPGILINNTGIFKPGNIGDEEDGFYETQMATNIDSAYYVTRSLLPAMKAHKSGHIFNICSVASLQAYPNGGSYSISKFALAGFSKNLREELKPHGIKVTGIFSGAVMTDSWGDFDNRHKRIMEVEDIATMVYAATQLSPAACVEEIIIRPQLGDL